MPIPALLQRSLRQRKQERGHLLHLYRPEGRDGKGLRLLSTVARSCAWTTQGKRPCSNVRGFGSFFSWDESCKKADCFTGRI